MGARIKSLLLLLLPPIVPRVLSLLRYRWLKGDFSLGTKTWEGIYSREEDVPKRGGGFNEAAWLEILAQENRTLSAAIASNLYSGLAVQREHMLLPFLASLMEQKEITVVDFGGALGISFLYMKASLKAATKIQYKVVESESVCNFARNFFKSEFDIEYYDDISKVKGRVDIFYSRTSTQYVPEIEKFLASVFALRPKYVLYTHLCAGNVPGFVTGQVNMPGNIIPYRFQNLQDFLRIHSDNGYSPIFLGGSNMDHEMKNFPEEYRIQDLPNLLFLRNGEAIS